MASASSPSSEPIPTNPAIGTRIVSTSFWLILQEIADLALAFTFTWIALRRYGPAYFGLITLTQAVLNLGSLPTLNLEQALIRLIPEFQTSGYWRTARWLVKTIVTVKLSLAILFSIALFGFSPLLSSILKAPELIEMIRIGCISILFAALTEVGAATALGLLQPQYRTFTMTIRRTIEVSLLIYFSSNRTHPADGILALALADMIAASTYWILLIRLLRSRPESTETFSRRELLKRAGEYALPLYGARLTEIFGREIGKLFLGRLASATAVGYYSVARLATERIQSLLSQAPLASVPVIASTNPDRSKHQNLQQKNQATLDLLKYQLIAANMIAIILSAIAPWIIQFLGSNEYAEAIPVFRMMIIGVVFWGATATLHALFLINERTIGILYLNSALIVSTVVPYMFFIRPMQAFGAAISDSLGQVFTYAIALFLAAKFFQFPTRVAFKQNMQLIATAGLLSTTFFVLPEILYIQVIALSLAIFLYITFLLGAQFLPANLWEQVSNLKIPLPLVNRFIITGARGLQVYQNWLLRIKVRG